MMYTGIILPIFRMTDVKFSYAGHSDFTSGKTDMPAFFREDP